MDAKVMKRVRGIGMLLLAVTMCSLFFCHLDPWRSTRMFDSYFNLIPFVFLGITFCLNHSRRSVDVWLGYLWLGWFVISRGLQGDLYMVRSSILWFNYDCIACLFALAFAWAMQDGREMRGVKLTAAVMLVITTALYAVGLYAAWVGKIISIPRIGGQIGIGEDLRLNVLTHPNTTGAVAAVTLLLGVWLLAATRRRRWLAVPCGISFVILFTVCALSTSRTSMIQIACFLGMMAGLLVLRCWTKGKKLVRLLCAALAAIVVFVVSYESFTWIVSGMNAMKNAAQNSRAMAAEIVEVQASEPVEEAESEIHVRERPITEGLTTLTGRTDIFKKAIEILRSNPKILWLGTVHRTQLDLGAVNAHNAYLQVALCLGIPGLLIALAFSLRVLWLSAKVFFFRFQKASVPELIMACMLPAMMLNTITEPILFYDAVPVFNVIFFLLYGYLSEAERRLRAA